jgi:hypothetical protein
MLQGKMVCLVIKGSHTIYRHLHQIATISGISHGIQHADIGAHPADNQLLRVEPSQLLRKRGIKKGAVMPLKYNLPPTLSQLRNDLCLNSALNAMGRKHFKLRVIGGMTVTKEKYLSPLSHLLLKKSLNIRDNTTGTSPTIKRVTLFHETPDHIYY